MEEESEREREHMKEARAKKKFSQISDDIIDSNFDLGRVFFRGRTNVSVFYSQTIFLRISMKQKSFDSEDFFF